MLEPLFLDAVFQEKIWGGTKLKDLFGYNLKSDKIGECWAISAHPNGVSKISNGIFSGMGLDELWATHPELFGHLSEPSFPLLTKILDAADDLSVQVHPDDVYGKKNEGELGKTECWYIIHADEGSEIIYGHHAKSKSELKDMIDSGDWEHLLTRIPVQAGDFFFVPSGTVHAIGKGIIILETQQSSDTTYRVYDYDRKDDDGNTRELHIQQSLDVITVPSLEPKLKIETLSQNNSEIVTFIQSDYFSVYKWTVMEELEILKESPYMLVSVLEGEGSIALNGSAVETKLSKGKHFILTSDVKSATLKGNMTLIASTPGSKNI